MVRQRKSVRNVDLAFLVDFRSALPAARLLSAAILALLTGFPGTLLVKVPALSQEVPPQASKTVPQEVDDLAFASLQQARTLENEGNFGAALATLDRAILLVQGDDNRPSPAAATLLADASRIAGKAGLLVDAAHWSIASTKMKLSFYPPDQFPAGHADLVISLANTGETLRCIGQHTVAQQYTDNAYQMAKTIFPKQLFPQGHPSLGMIANDVGVQRLQVGDYEDSLGYFEESLDNLRGVYPAERVPDGHPDLALVLSNRAQALQMLGSWDQSQIGYAQSLQIVTKLREQQSTVKLQHLTALVHNNRGSLSSSRADFDQALADYLSALDLYRQMYPKQIYPAGHPDLAVTLHNLAVVYETLGESTAARNFIEQSIEQFSSLKLAGDEEIALPEAPRAWETFARLQRASLDLKGALAASEQAVKAHQKIVGSDTSPAGQAQLGRILLNRASTHRALGDLKSAHADYHAALACARKVLAMPGQAGHRPARELLARSLNNLSLLEADQQQFNQAAEHLHEALQIQQELYPKADFPNGHVALARATANLGRCLLSQGKQSAGVARITEAYLAYRRYYQAVALGLSEGEAMNLSRSIPRLVDDLLSYSDIDAKSTSELYQLLCTQRGMRHDLARRRFTSLQQTADSATHQKWEIYLQIRRDLARIYLHHGRPTTQDFRDTLLRKASLERELGAQVRRLLFDEGAPFALAPALQEDLPAECAVVEFFLYNNGRTGRSEYCAFLLTSSGQIVRLELGDSRPIDEAIKAWRAIIEVQPPKRQPPAVTITGEAIPRIPTFSASAQLAKLVWQPIAQHLPEACQTIYLIADGTLHFVPWGAIPIDDGTRYLIEKHQLLTAPNVPWLLSRLADQTPSDTLDRFVGIGGVYYDSSPLVEERQFDNTATSWSSEMADWDYWKTGREQFLPGSAMELQYFAHHAQQRPKIVLSGRHASYENAVAALRKATCILLSTHGVYKTTTRSPLMLDSREILDDREVQGVFERSPLLRLLLSLSGEDATTGLPLANQRNARVLTAHDVATLPLQDAKLVILSACQTSLGQVKPGEELFGFASAFHLAGSRNVISTQWSVADRHSSRLVMLMAERMYRYQRLPADALRDAQLAYLRSPAAMLLWDGESPLLEQVPKQFEQQEHDLRDPFYWSAFSLSGPGN